MKNHKNLALIIFIIMFFPLTVFATDYRAIRLGGENRILTAIEISKNAYEKSDTVILVEYDSPLDALLSTTISKRENAPILITSKKALSKDVKDEIQRLGASNIILVGIKNSFSENIEKDLSLLNISKISGQDPEEVAINIVKEVYGEKKDEIFLALGYGIFADALSIGSVSASRDIPLLLVDGKELSPLTIETLRDLNVKKVNIIGGPIAINSSVEDQLSSFGIDFERIYGSNREETAIKISNKYNPSPENIILANGYNYADAVTGGYLAVKKNASILLTRDDHLSTSTLEYLQNNRNNIYILGKEKAIGKIVESDILHLLNGHNINDEETTLKLPYKSITENDPTLEKGKRLIKREGIDGEKIISERLVRDEEEILERRLIGEKIVKKPIGEIVVIGSKEINIIKKEKLYFTSENTDLRESTTVKSKLLAKLPKGSHLDYISSIGAYHKISYKGKVGYLPSKLVKVSSGYKVNDTLIINKGYPLSSDFNPGINPEALSAFNKMKTDARKDGVTLNIFSDFRSYSYQVDLYKRYVKKDGQKKADTYSARAGHSEHQSGLAFDLGGSTYNGTEKFGEKKEGIWLAKNCCKYGFILRYPKGKDQVTGYTYEPWHFRYVGVDLANKIQASGLTLDEYFGGVKVSY